MLLCKCEKLYFKLLDFGNAKGKDRQKMEENLPKPYNINRKQKSKVVKERRQ